MTWTLELDKKLLECIKKGLPYSRISNEIGKTKNACISRAHRHHGINNKPRADRVRHKEIPYKPETKPMRLEPEPIDPIDIPIIPVPEIETNMYGCYFLELTNDRCKWPISNPPDLRFCGKPAPGKLPYCEYHCSIGYVPIKQRKPKQGFYKK